MCAPGIFLGFKPNTKGYLVYNLHSNDLVVSRNVIFYENHFPSQPETQQSQPLVSPTPFVLDHFPFETHDVVPVSLPTSSAHTENNSATPLRRSTQDRRPPTYLHDYHAFLTSTANTNSASVSHPLDYSTSVCHPLDSVLSYSRLSSFHRQV